MDSTKVKCPIDSCNNQIPINVTTSTPYWINPVTDIIVAYNWPILIMILILIFRKGISNILHYIAEYFKNLDEASYGQWKFKSKQGKTETVTTGPSADATTGQQLTPEPGSLTEMNIKILSTLWHYQQAFKTDYSKRWTFNLGAFHPDYPAFVTAMRDLAARGIVAQDPKSGQFLLTDIGIFYCQQNANILTVEPFQF